MPYQKKAKLENPQHRCECGQPGVIKARTGVRRICQRCFDAEALMYSHSTPLIPRVNAAARPLEITLIHSVRLGARGRAHLAFSLEAA
jgi:hypothetical protein